MMPQMELEHESTEGQADNENANDETLGVSVPKVNCPEKIIFCLDLTAEMNSTSLLHSKSAERSVFKILQTSLELYVKNKLGLNKRHSFALVTLEDTAQWFQDFSCDVNFVCDTLHHLSPSTTESYRTFDMTSLFEIIDSHVELPVVDNIDLPPQHVVRVIMVYGRSHSDLPRFTGERKQMFDKYMASPYFFFDVLYVHELPDEGNNCEAVYDTFCKLDEKEDCFMLEVSRSVTRLFDHAAKLLAHPLQRPRQQDIDYKLVRENSSDEELDPE